MENKNSNNFEVRITDVRTGEEKYVVSNCIFLVAYEECGTRLIRLSQCDLLTKSALYSSVQFCLNSVFEEEPVLGALVHGLLEIDPIVKEDV